MRGTLEVWRVKYKEKNVSTASECVVQEGRKEKVSSGNSLRRLKSTLFLFREGTENLKLNFLKISVVNKKIYIHTSFLEYFTKLNLEEASIYSSCIAGLHALGS